MKPYEKPLSPQEYLMHYGVKGMKWGVRRYQNYDGSYTRKGLERYHKVESDYETAKSKADEIRAAYKSGQATRQQVKDAKSAVKTEKRKMENAYEKLKTDKLADEGKKFYQSGKRPLTVIRWLLYYLYRLFQQGALPRENCFPTNSKISRLRLLRARLFRMAQPL